MGFYLASPANLHKNSVNPQEKEERAAGLIFNSGTELYEQVQPQPVSLKLFPEIPGFTDYQF
jgi:hypothetical protein